MSWNDPDREDTTIYKVVLNHEEQYSIWPEYKANPLGWQDAGKSGPKADCLAYIKEVWTDMRPLSLRKKMEEMARNPPPPPAPPDPNRPKEKSLVDRLCENDHPVEAGLRPEKTVKLFKEAIDRNYVHIKFTDTRGGTELGVRLDRDACDFTGADFEAGSGSVHVEGGLTLDYVKVKCIADIELGQLAGRGRLERVEAQA
ncbi:MAG: MbtH domain-containing protein [Blastocatellia bacterium AA13]|nr:MAG: MbtH domain-containing protein [Blastocatellia bacterium AA13]